MPQISLLRKIIITIKSSWILLRYSLAVSYYAKRNQLSKAKIMYWQRYIAKGVLDVIQATLQINNPHRVKLTPQRPYIIMSNHNSLYDIAVLFLTFPAHIIGIGRRNLTKIPILGKALIVTHMMAIDRKNLAQANQDYQAIKQKLESGGVFFVFPEGTRSRSGNLQPFELSAFRLARETKATIIPIGLKGTGEILPPRTLNFKLKKCIEVNLGAPIDAANYTAITQIQLVKKVTETIKTLIGETENMAADVVKYNQYYYQN